MRSPLNTITEFGIVKHRLLATNEHAVMLSWKNRYAVCKTQPERSLVITKNYDCPENSVLTAPLNMRGLQDLLSWVDLQTAVTRFNQLVVDFGKPLPRLCAAPN